METSVAQTPRSFEDKSAALTAFGILEILLGVLCAAIVPLVLIGQLFAARMTGEAALNLRTTIPSLIAFGVLSVILVWLGIGSMRARRWARVLALILAWSWLLFGVLSMLVSALVMTGLMHSFLPSEPPMPERFVISAVVLVATMGFAALCLVAVPGAMIHFYGSGNVKATFEARDPDPAWTDACPPDVLAMSLWTGIGGVCMLFAPLAYNGVAPVFGRLVSGLPGTAVSVAFGVVWVYSGWAMYKLRVSGWWIAVSTLTLGFVSGVVTFAQVDPTELYRTMGFPEIQVELIEQMGYDNKFFVGWMAIIAVPFLGYMVYLKKYFHRPL